METQGKKSNYEPIGEILYNYIKDCKIFEQNDDSIIYADFVYPVLKERISTYKGAFLVKKSDFEVSNYLNSIFSIVLDEKEKFKMHLTKGRFCGNSIYSIQIEVSDEYGDEINAIVEVTPTEYGSTSFNIKPENIKELFKFIKEEISKYSNLDNILT